MMFPVLYVWFAIDLLSKCFLVSICRIDITPDNAFNTNSVFSENLKIRKQDSNPIYLTNIAHSTYHFPNLLALLLMVIIVPLKLCKNDENALHVCHYKLLFQLHIVTTYLIFLFIYSVIYSYSYIYQKNYEHLFS